MNYDGLKLVIGVDIGTAALKAVLLERKNQELSCLGYLVHKFPEDQRGSPEGILQGLQEVHNAFGKKTKTAVLVTNDQCVQLKFFDKPATNYDIMARTLINEFSSSLPPGEEEKGTTGFAFSILGENKIDNVLNSHILSATVPVAFLKEKVALFARAKLSLVGIYPLYMAMKELYVANYSDQFPTDTPELAAILRFGGMVNHILVVDRSNIRMGRTFPAAGEDITRAITKTYKTDTGDVTLDKVTAENFKTTLGLLTKAQTEAYSPTSIEAQVAGVIHREIERMIPKLRLSLEYFKGQTDLQLSKAFLFGGGAALRNLLDFIDAPSLGVVEIHQLSLLKRISFAPVDSSMAEPPMEIQNFLGLAIGTALCGMKNDQAALNLYSIVRGDYLKKLKKMFVDNLPALATVLGGAVIPLIYFSLTWFPEARTIEKLQKESERLNTEFSQVQKYKIEYDNLVKERNELKIRSTFIENTLARRMFWSKGLHKFGNLMPDDIWLTNFNAVAIDTGTNITQGSSAGQRVVITGISTTHPVLSRFLKDLEGSNVFRSVKLDTCTRILDGDILKDYLNFSITCDVFNEGENK